MRSLEREWIPWIPQTISLQQETFIKLLSVIKSKSNTQDTLYTSTLAKPFQSTTGDVDLDFNKIDITKDISINFFKLLVLNFFSSCDFADETIQLRFSIMTTSKTERPNGIVTPHNLFATLKYAVEVSFFRWQNIPLNYFTKSLLQNLTRS